MTALAQLLAAGRRLVQAKTLLNFNLRISFARNGRQVLASLQGDQIVDGRKIGNLRLSRPGSNDKLEGKAEVSPDAGPGHLPERGLEAACEDLLRQVCEAYPAATENENAQEHD